MASFQVLVAQEALDLQRLACRCLCEVYKGWMHAGRTQPAWMSTDPLSFPTVMSHIEEGCRDAMVELHVSLQLHSQPIYNTRDLQVL